MNVPSSHFKGFQPHPTLAEMDEDSAYANEINYTRGRRFFAAERAPPPPTI